MSFCQSVRYALGIYAICFLLNGISSVEDTVREQYAATAVAPATASATATKAAIEPEGRALFNPRVDYNQWTPVGHADPLKNDPTFDYVPPTLGSVRYWSESSEAKSNGGTAAVNNTIDKSEVLLLGAPVEHSAHVQSNHLPQQPEVKSANRRSSPYYPPEPSRVLTPPSIQAYMSSYDQSTRPSEYNYYATPSSNYWNNDLPAASYPSDAHPEESASYVTVIRPKTHPHPYSSTIYNKNVRNPIYNLAANVNSLESEKKNPYWIQTLLQNEITYQLPSTTPTLLPYKPHVYEPQSTNVNIKVEAPPKDTLSIEHSFAEPTTPAPTIMTTDPLFSHYNQPALPVRGPMYLIIQGHSKVKTYGADQRDKKPEKHEVKMVPVTVKDDLVVKHLVTTDQNGNEIQVKHLHKLHTPEVKPKTSANKPTKKPSNSPMMDSLLSLLDTSWANFGLNNNNKTKSSDLKKATEKTATSITKASTIFGPTTIRPNSDS